MNKKEFEVLNTLFEFLMMKSIQENKTWLYSHEHDAAEIILKRIEKGGYSSSLWVHNFITINKENIQNNNKYYDFNLKQAKIDGRIE